MLTLTEDTMLGDIPGDWSSKPLLEALSEHYPGDWGEDRGPHMTKVLRSTNLTNEGRLDLENIALRALPQKKAELLAPKRHDILLERSGGGPGQPVGRVGFIEADMLGHGFSNFLHLLRPNPEKINPRFLGWVLYRINQTGRIIRLEQQTTQMRNLNFRDYLTMPVPVPPPSEQAAIARILDAVEKALERIRARLAAAKTLAASLAEEAVSGKLITAGMRSCEGSVWTHPRMGTIPTGWSVDRLGKLCARIVDGTHQAVETSNNGVPFLYVSCIREGRILWKNASSITERTYTRISKGREPQAECVLYTAVGSYGNPALVSTSDRFSFQRHIAILYPKITCLRGGYLAIWLNSSKGRRWSEIHAVGNAQKTVTLTELGKLLIAFPSPEVQAELCKIVASADAVVDAINDQLDALNDLRRSFMHDLLTGRVRVTNTIKAAAP